MKHCRRQGVALILVVIVMTVASVMAYSLLAGATVQEINAASQVNTAQADALAESGVELAMYYLQHPSRAPSTSGAATGYFLAYWSGASGLTFSGMNGTVNVTVTPYGTLGNQWTVSATASTTGAGGTLTKTDSAVVQVMNTFSVQQALTDSKALTLGLNMFLTGSPTALVDFGSVTMLTGSHINGAVYAPGLGGAGLLSGLIGSLLGAPSNNPVPPYNVIRDYTKYRYNNGTTTYFAQPFVSGKANIPTLNNPAGIFIQSTGDATLSTGTSIQGMLYVPNGNVDITGVVTVQKAVSGYPVIVTSGAINNNIGGNLSATGLIYASGGINAALGGNISITGALVMDSGINLLYLGTLHVTYASADVNTPDFTQAGTLATQSAVKIVAWNP